MSKKSLLFFIAFVLTGCAGFQSETDDPCPRVELPRESAYMTLSSGQLAEFRIELTGYEGYCYFDENVGRRKAVITPLFLVKKLSNTDESDVHFDYYARTLKGPPGYLGTTTYSQVVSLQTGETSKRFRGKTLTLKVPNEQYRDFTIELGLNISKNQLLYNDRTFDAEYGYFDRQDARQRRESPKPPAARPQPRSSCSSCSLAP